MSKEVVKPTGYVYDGWRLFLSVPQFCIFETTLRNMAVNNDGYIPYDLSRELDLQCFASSASIPIVDPDCERDIIFPHPVYASRTFIRELYSKFIDNAIDSGWISDDDTAEFQLQSVEKSDKAEEEKEGKAEPRRGRPPGSKNKTKTPVVEHTSDN